ncbi:MAG: hypothetical protein DHS20C16_06460 [Phycisphaerae bacterium]|nr:MAG: hypothetical protein DHS20C16_06460 [Phycisphaerae bacterium]
MGLIRSSTTFSDTVPSLKGICAEIESISGLPVTVIESEPPEFPNRELYRARIAFACSPEGTLKVRAFRNRLHYVQTIPESPGADACEKEVENSSQSHSDALINRESAPVAEQSICLTGYVGNEMTLFFVTELALEALGGTPHEPIDDDVRNKFARSISEQELKLRRKETKDALFLPRIFQRLFLLVFIPMLLVMALVTAILDAPTFVHERLRKKGESKRN